MAAFGEGAASQQGIAQLAAAHGMTSEDLANKAIDAAMDAIAAKIESLVTMVNTKPVYTIHEILEDREIRPQKLIVIGSPAAVFQQLLAKRLGLTVEVPPLHGVANAVGAALTRTTSHLALSANTARGRLSVPMLGIFRSIGRGFSLDEAIAEARTLLVEDLAKAGISMADDEIQITQADSFNMVEGSYTAGKNIRVVAQVRPAVVSRLEGDPIPVHTV
jgi:hypothetical protein